MKAQMLTNTEIKAHVDTLTRELTKDIKPSDEPTVTAISALVTSTLIALHEIAEALRS